MSDQEGVDVPLDELREAITRAREDADKFNSRWILGLAIGNGGALLALGSKILDKLEHNTIALAMPSLWFFTIGLTFAGAIPLLEATRSQKWMKRYRNVLDTAELNGSSVVRREPYARSNDDNHLIFVLELASAGAFLAGIVYPLAALCIRYFQTGSFLG